MRHALRISAFFALFVLLTATVASAAIQNAVLYGTVYDTAGKPMAGVTVLLENPSLSLARVTITSPDGTYTIAEIPPAEGYRVTALRSGQKIDVREGIAVNVGDERVIVPPLREQVVGTAREAVPKAVEKGLVTERMTAANSGVITGEQLRSLPLYNRNFLALGLLTPNTHDVEGGSALAGATFSIAGARPTSNAFLFDGMDNVASSSNQAIPFQVNDSVQEFRVISSLAGAEFGRNLGGVVNVVTRRASTGFHGSAFGFFAGDALNSDRPLSVYKGSGFDTAAAYAGTPLADSSVFTFSPTTYNGYVNSAANLGNFLVGAPYCTDSLSPVAGPGLVACANGGFGKNTLFDPKSILATNDSHNQPFDSKQFGINLGGGLFKNKLFLFGSYEGTRIDNPNQVFERVPSSFDKTYNPLLAMGYPGATPFNFASTDPNYQFAQNVLALYPKSNVVAIPGVLEFFRGEAPNYTNVHNMFGRADIVQSDKSNWTFRYSVQALDQLHDATLPPNSNYAGNGVLRNALNQNFSGTFTHSLTSTLVNEARAGFTRFRVDEDPQDRHFNQSTLGLPNGQLMTFLLSGIDPQYSGTSILNYGAMGGWADAFWLGGPTLNPTLDGLFPFARIGAPMSAPGARRDTTISFADNLTWSRGRHAVKFGAEFRRLSNYFMSGALARGVVVSGNIGEFTSDAETCTTCAFPVAGSPPDAFFAPSFDYALRQPSPYAGTFYSNAFGGYIQDTWRLHPRITLTAGLRYEYFSPPEADNHNVWNFDPVANGLVREGDTHVVNPYGVPCGGTTTFGALYPDLAFPTDWTCKTTGSGRTANADHNNFAPRIGMAIDLSGTGRTILRFGAGWYYDQLPASYAAQLLFNRPTPLSLTNPAAIYGQNFLSSYTDQRICIQCGFGNITLNPANITAATQNFQAASSPLGVVARDVGHSDTPYSRQISVSVQQQITNKFILEGGYSGTFGVGLPVVYNSGFNNEWFCTTTPGCDFIGPVFTMTNRAESTYHSLIIRARAAEWHGFRVNATYTYSRSTDNASNSIFPFVPVNMVNQLLGFQLFGVGNPYIGCSSCGGKSGSSQTPTPGTGSVAGSDALSAGLTTTGEATALVSHYNIPQDPVNFLRNDKGYSDFNMPHRFVMDFTWQVPSLNKAFGVPKLLDNWAFSGIFNVHSGQPYTIFSGPIFGEMTQRANVTGPLDITHSPDGYIGSSHIQLASDSCGWLFTGTVLPGPGAPCLGNSRRNGFSGPGFAQLDFAIEKKFPISESTSLSFRTEFFNLFNRANYFNPISELSADGTTLNPQFGQIMSSHDPREIQFAVRFRW